MAKKKSSKKKRVRKDTQSSKSSKKTKKSKSYRKGSLGNAIREYFDEVGVDEADYEHSKGIALKIMPQSKYSKSHFSWYKNDYRKREEAAAAKTKRGKNK